MADQIWAALGDVAHYIEPFCGSCAVLLLRPKWHRRKMETVNDADGHIANVWRALQSDPDAVAPWCDWPVNHADLMARKRRLLREKDSLLQRLVDDDDYYDCRLAGYYIWAASCWIGAGWARPNARPNIANAGEGVHRITASIGDWFRQLQERLRRVRVVCGDWTRVCGGDWQDDDGSCGMFFDPPYGHAADRDERLYATDSLDVAGAVRRWCMARGSRPSHRIVIAGYHEEHQELLTAGWRENRWSAHGGYGKLGRGRGLHNRHRESLFISPHCLEPQPLLFD